MNLTERARGFLQRNMTMDDALPTRMPAYVNSVAYLFGAGALSGLGVLILSGIVLCIFGPTWYHESRTGRFFNSLHFWAVQVFFGVVLLHLLTKYAITAWRGGRWKTWMAGVLIFGAAVFAGLTGFMSQTNWDSQWIALQAKDAMNALGVGGFFNTLDTGQVLTLHIVVLPVVIVGLVAIHLFLIRREGPVPPLEGGRSHEP